MEKIESMSNAKIKHAASLHLKKNREKTGECVAEGIRLSEMSAQSDWSCGYALVTEGAASKDRVKLILETLEGKGCPVYLVSDKLYRKAAATEEPQGLLLIMRREKAELDSVSCVKSFLVVLDGVQDPGNAGTILRTADAVGADVVVALEALICFRIKQCALQWARIFIFLLLTECREKIFLIMQKEIKYVVL